MTEKLEFYWSCLPIGKRNAISYSELADLWSCSYRKVRSILHELSSLDNGDDYVLIRSSKNKGFYLTDNTEEIEQYRRECMNRARHTFAPLKKITRVQKDSNGQKSLFDSPLKQLRIAKGLSQIEVCEFLKSKGENIDPPLLSKFENTVCSPTISQTMLLAVLYEANPTDLME